MTVCRRPTGIEYRLVLVVMWILLASLWAFAQSRTVALKGGKLLTVSHGTIENGMLVMKGGKIVAVGPYGSVSLPSDAQVIDVTGMTVYPGLIDSETHLGLTEISEEESTNDLVETSDEIMPHMHASDAFHAESDLIPVARINGVTNAIVAPDNGDTLPGQDSFIQLAGKSAAEMLIARDVAMPLNLTGAQRRNQSWEKRKFPQTRMGMAAQLRQTFLDAQDYSRRWADYEKRKREGDNTGSKGANLEAPKRDLKLEVLLPYLQGKKAVVLAAEEPSDLATAVGLAREFNLKFVLSHISHSHSVLDYVASLKVPVIVGPIYKNPRLEERYDAVFRLPGELYRCGVKIAFSSGGSGSGDEDTHNVRNLPYQAGFATSFGLPYDEALKAITINPAEIWGMGDKLGSLDVGKTANVVIADGDPLDVKTDVKQVFIEGQQIPMTSRQTRLRDEYSK